MRAPSFAALNALAPTGHTGHSYAQRMHPNAQFYKYRWWVFWQGSPVDGPAFLEDTYSISTATAMHLMDLLEQQNLPYRVYNRKLARLEPGVTPFDPLHPRWRNTQFAVPLDADLDPPWQTHR